MPNNDAAAHQAAPSCACRPFIETVAGAQEKIAIHNAWDCREPYERMTGVGRVGKTWATVPVDES